MLASIFAICDDFDGVDKEHLTSMWPGLRIVVDTIERDLSGAIDALDRLNMEIRADGDRP